MRAFRLKVLFPRRLIDGSESNIGCTRRDEGTETHICFVVDEERLTRKPLYPQERMPNPLPISYHIDNALLDALGDKIYVKLYSGDMTPVELEHEVRDFQRF